MAVRAPLPMGTYPGSPGSAGGEPRSPGVRLRGFSWARPDPVESVHDVGVQLQRHRAEVRLQLLGRPRADDGYGDSGVVQQPGQRDVRGHGAELSTKPFVGLELVAVRLDPALLALVCDAPVLGGCEGAGEQTEVQRAVRDKADSEGAQRGNELQLHRSYAEVVKALLGGQAQEVPCRRCGLSEGRVPRSEVAAADVCDLALAHQLLHRLPYLLPRRLPVDVVHLVEVDVVGLQSAQARLARAPDVVGGQPAVVGAETHRLVHLRGEDDVVAVAASSQPAADDLLRDAVPLAMSAERPGLDQVKTTLGMAHQTSANAPPSSLSRIVGSV